MTPEELKSIANHYRELSKKCPQRVIVCAGTGCIANGSLKVFEKLQEECKKLDLNIALELKEETADHNHLSKSGCQGFCQLGPLVTLEPHGVLYTKVQVSDVPRIVKETLVDGKVIEDLLYKHPQTGRSYTGQADIPFYARQHRFVLKQCGSIDPEDIAEYISLNGYEAARKALCDMTPAQVCREISDSGLRGRGGGGFLTGKKWELTRVQPGEKKFVICNGDEGDPGAFMDRSVMEGNPHAVIEGMLIAAHAIGADEGYVYVRAEYPLAVARIKRAVVDATRLGILGKNIFSSKTSFTLHVMEGAGAFVCGEETALMSSIEGQRGMPNPKPPFPAQSGLEGKPTVINNVETLGTIPLILNMGSQEYRKIGTPTSPGTKTFALTGHVANTGLIEVPFGTTLREIVMEIGGGVIDDDGKIDNQLFKAVQIGGPSGGCLVAEHLDLSLDFDSLSKMGAMVGSGGLVVMNAHTCMVRIAHFFMQFTQNESCGKCVPCREGTRQLLSLLDEIREGQATQETLATMVNLADVVKKASLCGLGKTAPNPVLSTMRYFQEEYQEHVVQKICRCKECKKLLRPEISPSLCKGCTLCAKKCPVGAISGTVKSTHIIDAEKCIKCGVCANVCKFHAVTGV